MVIEAVLEVMRRHMRLSVGVVAVTRLGVGEVWRVEAIAESGERWVVEHAEYDRAVILLAEAVGMELRE